MALKSTSRWATRARRSTSAWAVERGLASIDWQTENSDHTPRAEELFFKTDHSWYTFGMLATKTSVDGEPLEIVFIAAVNWASKLATLVIVDSDDVQMSLPPMRTVT